MAVAAVGGAVFWMRIPGIVFLYRLFGQAAGLRLHERTDMKRSLIAESIVIGLLIIAQVRVPVFAGEPASVSTRPAQSFSLDLTRQLEVGISDTLEVIIQHKSLNRVLDAAKTSRERAAANLAMANWVLSRPIAGAATRWLVGLDTPDDRVSINGNAKTALKYISEARSILDSGLGIAKRQRGQLLEAADTLESFSKVFKAVSSSDGKAEYKSACSAAALKLSVVREADDGALSSCALLWQSFALERAGRRERALLSLPQALKQPEHWPYDFMCRLLRCRILADADEYAAAMVMTMQIQALCDRWLKGRTEETEPYQRLAGLLQCRIGLLWKDRLGPSEAAGLEAILVLVQDKLFGPDDYVEVFHLEHAVPIIVEPPVIATPATSTSPTTTSAPATKPSSPLATAPATSSAPAGMPGQNN